MLSVASRRTEETLNGIIYLRLQLTFQIQQFKKSLGGLNTVATLRYKIAEDLEGLKVWQSRVFPVHFTIFPTCKKGWAIVLTISQQSSCQNLPRLLCATHSFDVSKSSRSIKRQTFWFLTTQYWLTYGQLKKTGSEGTRSEKDTKQKYIWNWTRAGQPHQVCDRKPTVSLLVVYVRSSCRYWIWA